MTRGASLAVVAVLSFAAAAPAQAPQFRWRTGQVLTYKVSQTTTADEIIAGKLAYAPEYFGGEAHPVFEPAAPFVVAAIGERRPELIDNGVIGSEDFDAVEQAWPRPVEV